MKACKKPLWDNDTETSCDENKTKSVPRVYRILTTVLFVLGSVISLLAIAFKVAGVGSKVQRICIIILAFVFILGGAVCGAIHLSKSIRRFDEKAGILTVFAVYLIGLILMILIVLAMTAGLCIMVWLAAIS